MAIVKVHTNCARTFLICPACGKVEDVDPIIVGGAMGVRRVASKAEAHRRGCPKGKGLTGAPRLQVRSCTMASLVWSHGSSVMTEWATAHVEPGGGELIHEKLVWSWAHSMFARR